jgi:hypothetical protein
MEGSIMTFWMQKEDPEYYDDNAPYDPEDPTNPGDFPDDNLNDILREVSFDPFDTINS